MGEPAFTGQQRHKPVTPAPAAQPGRDQHTGPPAPLPTRDRKDAPPPEPPSPLKAPVNDLSRERGAAERRLRPLRRVRGRVRRRAATAGSEALQSVAAQGFPAGLRRAFCGGASEAGITAVQPPRRDALSRRSGGRTGRGEPCRRGGRQLSKSPQRLRLV